MKGIKTYQKKQNMRFTVFEGDNIMKEADNGGEKNMCIIQHG